MSPRRNWDSPNSSHPLSRQRVCPSPQNRDGGGWHTRLRVRGWGSSNSDDLRKSLALCLLCAVPNLFSRVQSRKFLSRIIKKFWIISRRWRYVLADDLWSYMYCTFYRVFKSEYVHLIRDLWHRDEFFSFFDIVRLLLWPSHEIHIHLKFSIQFAAIFYQLIRRDVRAESILWFIKYQTFLRSYDSAHRPPPSPLPVSKLPLFLSLLVCRWSSLLTREERRVWGREPNHVTAGKPALWKSFNNLCVQVL